MKTHISLSAGAAAGVSAVGAVTVWMAASVLTSAHAESVWATLPLPRHRLRRLLRYPSEANPTTAHRCSKSSGRRRYHHSG